MKTILFFGAPRCQYCGVQLEMLFNIDFPKILIDVDQAPDIAQQFGVTEIPTTMLVDIEVSKKKLGVMTKEKLDKFLGIDTVVDDQNNV